MTGLHVPERMGNKPVMPAVRPHFHTRPVHNGGDRLARRG